MFLAVSCRIYGACLIHILTHAFVKATCFVSSGVKIGMTGTQELRRWAIENQMVVIVMSFLLLCGVRRSMVYNSKEIIVLQIVILLVVLIGWKYTKVFFNNIRGMNTNLIKMNYSIVMLVVLGGTGFRRMELILVLVIVGGLIPIVNSWSGYVANK
jgi:NADH:ubiquinone oxidoreductase subunit 5 (subunit L)/multisubunit Na+/H+ antiporter MnhA subunit